MKHYPLYPHTPVSTIRELLVFCADSYGDKIGFQYQQKKDTVSVSFRQFQQDVNAFGSYLFDEGFRDCQIAVMGENSYGWILTHFAVVCGKNVIVPIDKDLSAAETTQLLEDSDCRALVYSPDYSDIAQAVSQALPELVTIDMKAVDGILEQYRSRPENADYTSCRVCGDDLASIVYTSGTTGKSKGVMLTHNNFMSDLYAASCNAIIHGTSILLLPLHHTFGLVAGLYSVMYYGHPLFINKSLKRVLNDFQTAKPQNTFVVPLIVETLHKNIWITAKKQGKDKLLKGLIMVSNGLRKCGIDLRKQLFKSVIAAFGGNLEVIICGGAPLRPELVTGMDAFGVTVMNGYGITECAPIVSVNRNKFNVVGSVGLPLCCNQVKIAEDGEILVKGSNVMMGYYKNEAENSRVFTDGWFHTGDLGRIDQHGALYIVGRIKNLIILSNGENISAESIEEAVHQIPYVKEVIAYGENDRIVAEIYLDPEVPDGKDRIHADIKAVNHRLSHTRNIAEIRIRDTEFPKTTTKKIKRNHTGE